MPVARDIRLHAEISLNRCHIGQYILLQVFVLSVMRSQRRCFLTALAPPTALYVCVATW